MNRICEKCHKPKAEKSFYRPSGRNKYPSIDKTCISCRAAAMKERKRKRAEHQRTVKRPLTLANQRKWSERTRNAITPHCRLCDRPLTLSNEGERTWGHAKECVWNPKQYRPTFKAPDGRKKGAWNKAEIVANRVRYEARCISKHDFVTNLAEPLCPFCRTREMKSVEKLVIGGENQSLDVDK